MDQFQVIDTATAIVSRGGVYRQTELYTWRGEVFAKIGAGYIRLNADNSTSHAKTRWVLLSIEDRVEKANYGRLVYTPRKALQQIAAE